MIIIIIEYMKNKVIYLHQGNDVGNKWVDVYSGIYRGWAVAQSAHCRPRRCRPTQCPTPAPDC